MTLFFQATTNLGRMHSGRGVVGDFYNDDGDEDDNDGNDDNGNDNEEDFEEDV